MAAKESAPSSTQTQMIIALFILILLSLVILLLQSSKPKISSLLQQPVKTETPAAGTFTIADRQMDISDKWEVAKKNPTEVSLVVKKSSTEEQLTLIFISKNKKSAIEPYQNKENGEMINLNCLDYFLCTGVIVNDDFYVFNWQKTSNASKPILYAGTWTPPTPNITTDDVWKILKTIR